MSAGVVLCVEQAQVYSIYYSSTLILPSSGEGRGCCCCWLLWERTRSIILLQQNTGGIYSNNLVRTDHVCSCLVTSAAREWIDQSHDDCYPVYRFAALSARYRLILSPVTIGNQDPFHAVGWTLFQFNSDGPWPLYQGLRDGGFILEKDDGGRGRRLGWIACDLLMGARPPGLLTTSKALGQLRMECTPWTCHMSPLSDAPPRGRGV